MLSAGGADLDLAVRLPGPRPGRDGLVNKVLHVCQRIDLPDSRKSMFPRRPNTLSEPLR